MAGRRRNPAVHDVDGSEGARSTGMALVGIHPEGRDVLGPDDIVAELPLTHQAERVLGTHQAVQMIQ